MQYIYNLKNYYEKTCNNKFKAFEIYILQEKKILRQAIKLRKNKFEKMSDILKLIFNL